MRALIVTDELMPSGTARHVVDLANGLTECGDSVWVAGFPGSHQSLLGREVVFVPLPLFRREDRAKSLAGFVRSIGILLGEVRRHDIRIIHSHKRYSDLLSRVVARISGTRHLSTCQNLFFDLKILSVFGDFTIACSEEVRRSLVERYGKDPKRVERIYPGTRPVRVYSTDERQSVLRDLGAGPHSRVLASIGHFTRAKDRWTLVRAAAGIAGLLRESDVVILVVGDGPDFDGVKRLSAQLGIDDRVRCLPSMPDVSGVLNVAEFMVLSSAQEGVPYILLEAGSLGKPHIATAVGGVPEFVVDGSSGLLVPPSNPELLGGAIARLLRDPGEVRRLGEGARMKYEKDHTYRKFLESTRAVYERLLAE